MTSEILTELTYKDINDVGGTWHKHRVYKTKNGFILQVVGVITGCGLAQIHGVAACTLQDLKEILPVIIKDYTIDGAGCIIATLGQNYYDQEEKLLESGFELVKEYSNYRHGKDGLYTQRLYTLTY